MTVVAFLNGPKNWVETSTQNSSTDQLPLHFDTQHVTYGTDLNSGRLSVKSMHDLFGCYCQHIAPLRKGAVDVHL